MTNVPPHLAGKGGDTVLRRSSFVRETSFLSTALGAPVELVTEEFENVRSRVSRSGEGEHLRQLLSAIDDADEISSEKDSALLREIFLNYITTQQTFSRKLPVSLGLFSASSLIHCADRVLLQAERLLCAWAAQQPQPSLPMVWRLPSLSHDCPWRSLIIPRNDTTNTYLVVRVSPSAKISCRDILPSWLTWMDIFPDRVSALPYWPLEVFDRSLQTFAFTRGVWPINVAPFDDLQLFYQHNRTIEQDSLSRWLSRRLNAGTRISKSTYGKQIQTDMLLRKFDSNSASFAHLMGIDWTQITSRWTSRQRSSTYTSASAALNFDQREMTKEQTKLELPHSLPTERVVARNHDGHSVVVFTTRDTGALDTRLFVRGICCYGGRPVLGWEGGFSRVPANAAPPALAALCTTVAREIANAAAHSCIDEVSALIQAPKPEAISASSFGELLTDAFAADGMALWHHSSDDQTFSLVVAFHRPDLATIRSSHAARAIAIPHSKLCPTLGVPLTEHPLGPSWIPDASASSVLRESWTSILPIYVGDQLIGVLELIDRAPGRTDAWVQVHSRLVGTLGTFLSHFYRAQTRELAIKRSVRHQIRPAINALEFSNSEIVRLSKQRKTNQARKAINTLSGQSRQIISDLREFLESITDSPGDLTHTAGDPVLAFARSRAEYAANSAVDLKEQVKLAFDGMSPAMLDRSLSFAITEEGDPIRLFVAPENLQIILVNLASNATKYALFNSSIDIFLRNRPNDALLEISNIGGLMDDKERTLVFERGFRAFDAADSTVKGEGIGLYHVKGVARLYRAQVHYAVDASPGGGRARHSVKVVFPRGIVEDGQGAGGQG